MHLFDPALLAASDGIVGASAPLACGFALAAQRGGRGRVAVAFFGEGAANQGMLLESLNLARVWRLPVVFVCKDSGLAITTRRADSTGGDLVRRARAFGLPAEKVSGRSIRCVWRSSRRAVRRARRGKGPTFLLCRVHRPDGHFLGDPLLRAVHDPTGQARELLPPMLRALRDPVGARTTHRVAGMGTVGIAVLVAARELLLARWFDPLRRARRSIPRDVAAQIDEDVSAEVAEVRRALLDGSVDRA
jgi:pyruvate dehydrogenase E1 component alpha subunit